MSHPLPGQPPGPLPLLAPWAGEYLLAPLLRRWGATWEVTLHGLEHLRAAATHGPFIVSFFHETILITVHAVRDRNPVAVISPSWEGEIIARFVRGMGGGYVRGSSGHQPTAAIRESVRQLRNGHSLLWALDGPIGPRRMIQPGVFKIASLSGLPILPIHGVASPSWYLPTWDRQEVPKPFSRVAVGFGEPLYVPRRLRRDDLHDHTRGLLAAIRSLERSLAQSLVNEDD